MLRNSVAAMKSKYLEKFKIIRIYRSKAPIRKSSSKRLIIYLDNK